MKMNNMKKGILFAIITGVLSFVLATLFGYKIVDLGYWLVSIPVVVVLNVVYLLCKDDGDSNLWVSVDDNIPNKSANCNKIDNGTDKMQNLATLRLLDFYIEGDSSPKSPSSKGDNVIDEMRKYKWEK